MTSNLGSANILDGAMGREGVRDAVMAAVRGHFRPEFINRVDELIVFEPLARDQVKSIVRLQVRAGAGAAAAAATATAGTGARSSRATAPCAAALPGPPPSSGAPPPQPPKPTPTPVTLQVDRVAQRLAERKIRLEISEGAIEFLVSKGYDPVYGARPVKRAVQRELETGLAKSLLRGEFGDEDTVLVRAGERGLEFSRGQKAEVSSDGVLAGARR
jgi:ATP-dependent Clp protease ATP-binding subunit ClpA